MKVIETVRSGPFARWMYRRGWLGFTLPLPGLVVVFYWRLPADNVGGREAECRASVVHERTHVEQVRRYGWAGFVARYLWGLRKGYRASPLEAEAYARQREELHR